MTRLPVAVTALIVLIGSSAFAQDSFPKIQAFGGYSLFHADTGKLTATMFDDDLRERNGPFAVPTNFNGWNADAQYNFSRWLGVVLDVAGRYGSPITAASGIKLSGIPSGSGYTLLVGPVVSYRNKTKVTPYVHVLFGVDRASIGASTITPLYTPVSSTATTFTDFALALGGGIDYKVSRHFAIRVLQLDYLETTHNLNKFYGTAFPSGTFYGLDTRERNLRVSTGIVVSF